MTGRSLGLPAALQKAGSGAPGRAGAVEDEIRWQLTHMTAEVRAALSTLPPVGENSSGPLGAGLLASGQLGVIVRALQAGLGGQGEPDREGAGPVPATAYH